MTNMNKKGFTLIELLAVIVILAIIALIATPMITGIIESVRKDSAKSSAYGYLEGIEVTYANSMLEGNSFTLEGTYKIDADGKLGTNEITVKGKKPTGGSLTYESGKVTNGCLTVNEYKVTIAYGKVTTVAKGSCNGTPHKGVVYLDPTDLTTTCNASNSVSTTGTKTGCMKWYIYDDSGDKYKMILDHNTTGNGVAWNSDGTSTEMKEAKEVLESDTSEWDNQLTARLITAEEIYQIVGETFTGYEGLDSLPTWLHENTISSNRSMLWNYWTSTPYNTSGSTTSAWHVSDGGSMYGTPVADLWHNGVRPVIEVSKSFISQERVIK